MTVRPALPADLPAVAGFIARLNAHPAGQSLHCEAGITSRRLRTLLEDPEQFPGGWQNDFLLAGQPNSGPEALLGWQFDAGRSIAWLWGPWVDPAGDWSTYGPPLLAALYRHLPPTVRRVEAFLHLENKAGLRFLQTRGFAPGLVTHLYVFPRSGWTPVKGTALAEPLRPMHEVAFARLHAETFPAGGCVPAEALLADRDDQHAIFAASDGLRLLGSVCVSVNHAPSEGFVDYLTVRPSLRGRGIGTWLLQTALRWVFETQRLPQAALSVSDWRGGARRLYEQAGFRLQASGIAVRRKL